jgi:hypothetical protein
MGTFPVDRKFHRGWCIYIKRDLLKAVGMTPPRMRLADPAKIPEFPREVYWQDPSDVSTMILILDAVCEGDRRVLGELTRGLTGFTTNLTGYIEALARNALIGLGEPLRDLPPELPPLVPKGEPLTVFPFKTWARGAHVTGTLEYVNWASGEEIIRLTYTAGPSKKILSQVASDRAGLRNQVIEHHPGRWEAWGPPPARLLALIRSSPPSPGSRTG